MYTQQVAVPDWDRGTVVSLRMLRTTGYGLQIVVIGLASSSLEAQESEDEIVEPADLSGIESGDEIEEIEEAEEGWQGFHVGPLRIGGALRFNYIYKDWDEDYKGLGELAFDTARINLDLDADQLVGSFEYRYYRDKFADGHDYSMLHHGWLGWKFDDHHEVQGGVMKVPFGILPYASHNWFFQLPYYVGFEDDYDLGFKFIGDYGPWNVQAAYYFQDEGHYVGDSDDSARYSYDLVREGTEGNAEEDQLNFRLAYTFQHKEDYSTELGLSLMTGRVPNNNPLGSTGDRDAFAVHLNGYYDRWNVMLQVIRYDFDVENDPILDASPDGSFVTMGAYDAAYHVASKATIYTAGLAYTLPVDWGSIKSLTFYNDFSLMTKDESGFHDSLQNVIGCGVDASPFYIYIDVAMGWNHPWLGGDWTDGLASGGQGTGWNTRFNINIGFYF
jgi:hypothetical protein